MDENLIQQYADLGKRVRAADHIKREIEAIGDTLLRHERGYSNDEDPEVAGSRAYEMLQKNPGGRFPLESPYGMRAGGDPISFCIPNNEETVNLLKVFVGWLEDRLQRLKEQYEAI